jgi:hypothetical protein
MPKKAVDYSKTIIYKVVCNDINIVDLYVGSTSDFTRRKYTHKCACINPQNTSYNFKIYQTIRSNGGWINWTMVEIEKYPCVDSNEARARERHWFEILNASLNSYKPIIYKDELNNYQKEYLKEYRKNNADEIREQQKEYRKSNEDKLIKYWKEYYINNKEKLNETHKIYNENNREKLIEYQKIYKENNREKIIEYNKQYNKNNKAILEYKKQE